EIERDHPVVSSGLCSHNPLRVDRDLYAFPIGRQSGATFVHHVDLCASSAWRQRFNLFHLFGHLEAHVLVYLGVASDDLNVHGATPSVSYVAAWPGKRRAAPSAPATSPPKP